MSITITPVDTYPVADAELNFRPAFTIADTDEIPDELVNPISMLINFVEVEPYVRTYYVSSVGSPKTRVFVEYVPKETWIPGRSYRIDLTYTGVSTTTETFTFTAIDTNVVDKAVQHKISDLNPRIRGSFANYTRVAQDEFSLGGQLSNPFAVVLSGIRERLAAHIGNKFIQTFDLNTISTISRQVINKSILTNLDSPSLFFETKDVYAQNGLDIVPLTRAPENTIDSAVFDRPPDRISLNEVLNYGDFTIYGGTLEASLTDINFDLDYPSSVFVTITDADNVCSGYEDNYIYTTKILLAGKDKLGLNAKETLSFTHNQTIRTQTVWSRIDRIIIDTYSSNGTFSIDAFQPALLVQNDGAQISYSPLYKQTSIAYWDIAEDEATNQWILSKKFKLDPSAFGDLATTKLETSPGAYQNTDNLATEREELLLDSNEDPITVIDFTVDRFLPYVYVLGENGSSEQFLYVYSKYDIFEPTLVKEKIERTFNNPVFINMDYESNLTLRGGVLDVRLSAGYLPQRKVLNYLWRITGPDGVRRYISILNGTGTASNSSEGCIKQNDHADKFYVDANPFTITLDAAGLYRFELDTIYTDGVESKDVRYLYVRSKVPVAEFSADQLRLSPSYIIDSDDNFQTDENHASYWSFNWSPSRFSVFDSTLSNITLNLRSDITTSSISFALNGTTLSAAFGAASAGKILTTLSSLPAIGSWENATVTVDYENSLQDSFSIMRSGSFNKLFYGDRGNILLGTSTGLCYEFKFHYDYAVFDETSGELITLEPYRRVIVIE